MPADDTDLAAPELVAAHRPLADLVAARVDLHRRQRDATAEVLGSSVPASPYLVGITGAVAVGKTVSARAIASLLDGPHGLAVDVVSTDGFLLDNRTLTARGLLDRKGFPESYDHPALVAFLQSVKAGGTARAPRYDHGTYDVMVGHEQVIDRPDVLIVEGVNVLQPAPAPAPHGAGPRSELLVSDFLDLSIYLDADEPDVRHWFLERLRGLRRGTADQPDSFFAGFASLSDDEFTAMGEAVWASVNLPNLVDHIAPTRQRADLVVEKAADHSVRRLRLRPR